MRELLFSKVRLARYGVDGKGVYSTHSLKDTPNEVHQSAGEMCAETQIPAYGIYTAFISRLGKTLNFQYSFGIGKHREIAFCVALRRKIAVMIGRQ